MIVTIVILIISVLHHKNVWNISIFREEVPELQLPFFLYKKDMHIKGISKFYIDMSSISKQGIIRVPKGY